MLIVLATSCRKEDIKPTAPVQLNVTTFDGDWVLNTVDGNVPSWSSLQYNISDNKLTNNGVYSEITWTTNNTALLNNSDAYGFYLANNGNTLIMNGESELLFTK